MITNGLMPHDDGLAKYAATLFENSRSCVTRTSSRFSRASSSSCGLRRPFPRKRLDRIASDFLLPAPQQIGRDTRSRATRAVGRPLSVTSFTASLLNSRVNDCRICPMLTTSWVSRPHPFRGVHHFRGRSRRVGFECEAPRCAIVRVGRGFTMTQYPTIVSTKRGVQPVSGSKDARSARTLSSGHTTALQVLKASAHRCHTPKQFHELLDSVQAFIPYQKLSAVWGYDAHPTLRYVFNYGFPMGFTLVLLDGRVVDESSVSGMASEKTSSHGVRGRGAPPWRNLTLSSSSTTNRPGCKC